MVSPCLSNHLHRHQAATALPQPSGRGDRAGPSTHPEAQNQPQGPNRTWTLGGPLAAVTRTG
eukprot:6684289-Alexandrium_andersonii.AAC.1